MKTIKSTCETWTYGDHKESDSGGIIRSLVTEDVKDIWRNGVERDPV